jgi:prevent-host-death family protein
MLNQETSKVLARVKRGEEITLTERGEVIARIVPASAGPLDALISTGRVRPAAVRGPAPRPTIPMRGDLDAGTLLERMRAEERY